MQGYARAVRRVLLGVLALNLAVAVAKLVAGVAANSLSVLGDGLHGLVDALNNVVSLFLVYVASRPADDDHPYGHGKFESLGAFALSGLLFLTAFELGRSALVRLFVAPEATHVSAWTVGVVGVTLVANVAITLYERRAARRLGSELLAADAAHTASDVFVSLAVLGGFLAQRAGFAWADPALALLISGVIAVVGYRIFTQAAPILTDAIVFDPALVERIVKQVPGVESVHDIRSRGRRNEAFIQMHLVVESKDVVEAHRVTEAVERRLARELGAKEILIHVEPEDDSMPKAV